MGAIIYVPNIELLSDDRKIKRLSASNVTPLNDQNCKTTDTHEKSERILKSRTPIEVESIEDIISQIKKDCKIENTEIEKENISQNASTNDDEKSDSVSNITENLADSEVTSDKPIAD